MPWELPKIWQKKKTKKKKKKKGRQNHMLYTKTYIIKCKYRWGQKKIYHANANQRKLYVLSMLI